MEGISQVGKCPHCSGDLVPNKMYCPTCGLAIVDGPNKATVDAYVTSKVAQEVALLTKGEALVVRHLSNEIEDEVLRRFKRYSWILALAALLLAVYGISSIRDAKQTIVAEARTRVEPLITDVENRSKLAQVAIGNVEGRLPALSASLNATAESADKQRSRIEGQSAEIRVKLDRFRSASERADRQSSMFEEQLTSAQQRLDRLTRKYDAQLAQLSSAATNQAVAEQYPSLLQKPFLQAGTQNLDAVAKKSNEKWVSISITGTAGSASAISGEKLSAMMQELISKGYTPILGLLTAGGRGGGPIWRATSGKISSSSVIYFANGFQHDAENIASIARKYTSFTEAIPKLSDRRPADGFPQSSMDVLLRDGKLDAEIYISAPYR